jgi:hypothetical protein
MQQRQETAAEGDGKRGRQQHFLPELFQVGWWRFALAALMYWRYSPVVPGGVQLDALCGLWVQKQLVVRREGWEEGLCSLARRFPMGMPIWKVVKE